MLLRFVRYLFHLLYTPQKASTNQLMTTFDHVYTGLMEQVVALAVGLAPLLAHNLPAIDKLPSKHLKDADGKTIKQADGKPTPNANYETDVKDYLANHGKNLIETLPSLIQKHRWAHNSSRGLNVLYESLRRQRHLNFANEVRTKNEKLLVNELIYGLSSPSSNQKPHGGASDYWT